MLHAMENEERWRIAQINEAIAREDYAYVRELSSRPGDTPSRERWTRITHRLRSITSIH